MASSVTFTGGVPSSWWLIPCFPLDGRLDQGYPYDCQLTVHSAMVGVGRTMWQVVLGRVISGSGGSALNVLGLLLVTGRT